MRKMSALRARPSFNESIRQIWYIWKMFRVRVARAWGRCWDILNEISGGHLDGKIDFQNVELRPHLSFPRIWGAILMKRSVFNTKNHVRIDFATNFMGWDLCEKIDVYMIKSRAPWFCQRNLWGLVILGHKILHGSDLNEYCNAKDGK